MRTGPRRRLLAFLAAIAAPLISAGEAGAIDRYEPVEAAFTVSGSGSAYRSVDCFARFGGATPANGITPGGANREVPLYWDGGRTFRLRTVGRLAGTYDYTVRCTGGTPSPSGGSFTVGAAVSTEWTGGKGFVAMEGKFFRRDTGAAWYWFGDTSWLLPWSTRWWWQGTHWVNGMTMSQIRRWADDRGAKKFTLVQTSLSTPYIEGQKLDGPAGTGTCPFGCSGGARTDRDVDPAYYQNLDERIQYLVRHRLVIALSVDFDQKNLMQSFPGADATARNRYLQYIIARYGAYNVIWFGLQEHQEEGRGVPANRGYVWDFFNRWKQLDPYRHPLTTHTVHRENNSGTVQDRNDPEYGYWNAAMTGRRSGILALLDFVSGQEAGDGEPRQGASPGLNVDTATDDQFGYRDAREGRGLMNGSKGYVETEFGYERVAGIDPPSGYNDQVAKDLREDIWGHLTGGAAGFTYGDRQVWKFADLSRLGDPGAVQVGKLIDYVASAKADPQVRAYTRYAAGTGWTQACSTVQAFRCTMFFQTGGSNLAVDTVNAGPRAAAGRAIYFRWYNAVTGKWRRSDNSAATSAACESRTSGYGSSAPRFTRPTDEDATWVLLLKSEDSCPT